jgi:hypothetical protein
VRWFFTGFNMEFAVSALIVSSFWLALTRAQLGRLLRTYHSLFSRLEVEGPMGVGVLFAAMGLIGANGWIVRGLAAATLLYWGYIYLRYRLNQRKYEKQGHGPLPKGAWIKPPLKALRVGDILLYSGVVSETMRQAVGHTEWYVEVEGQAMALSSYFENGVTLRPMNKVVKDNVTRYIWIALRPQEPLTAKEIARAGDQAVLLLEQNEKYRIRMRAKRDRILSWLPVSESIREKLKKRYPITGYDWVGLWSGRRACDHFTCTGVFQEAWWRIGRNMEWLGSGLFGLGTGFGDPLSADELLDQPNLFRLLTLDDEAAFKQEQAAAPPASV